MRLFNRNRKPKITAIKLYCVGEPANREVLVSSILTSLQSAFGALPNEFDIHGPYGVSKGSTIGFKAFQNRLAKKGHEKYYALSGETIGQFGFELLLGANIGESIYSELILWFVPENYAINFLELVEPLLEPLNASCGFDIDIPLDHSIRFETKVRKSIFGSISVDANGTHLAWVPSMREGGIRGLFRNNIVNCEQLALLSSNGVVTSQPLRNGLHYIHSPE